MTGTGAARRSQLVRTVAATLLVFQSVATAGVGLLHASERLIAPAAVEAEHGKACVVLHDPARCPGCQVVGVAALPEPCRGPLEADARSGRLVAPPLEPRAAPRFNRAAAPRPPPTLSV